MLVQLKATRVVTLDAATAREALDKAEDAAFPGRHRRDKVKSMVAPGSPTRSSKRLAKPRVDVPD